MEPRLTLSLNGRTVFRLKPLTLSLPPASSGSFSYVPRAASEGMGFPSQRCVQGNLGSHLEPASSACWRYARHCVRHVLRTVTHSTAMPSRDHLHAHGPTSSRAPLPRWTPREPHREHRQAVWKSQGGVPTSEPSLQEHAGYSKVGKAGGAV